MQDPGVRKKLDNLEVMPVWLDSAETKKWLEEDAKKYGELIRAAGLVQRIRQRAPIRPARERRTGDRVNTGAVGGDYLLLEQRERLAVDVARGAPILRIVEDAHGGDPVGYNRHPHLHTAIIGVLAGARVSPVAVPR